jgi:hypothetical protein
VAVEVGELVSVTVRVAEGLVVGVGVSVLTWVGEIV